MTVEEAASAYLAARRAGGRHFKYAGSLLKVLCQSCGATDLRSLSAERLSIFVNQQSLSPWSRLSRFSAMTCFVRYWAIRGEMPEIRFQKPQRPQVQPSPYIYTTQQVRALLRGAEACQRNCKKLSGQTLHTMMLAVYGTGATIDEVLSLRSSDVHPRKRQLTLREMPLREERVIPIGADLHAALRKYVRATTTTGEQSVQMFRGRAKDAVGRKYLNNRFKRLCKIVDIPEKFNGRTPRMLDLRYTFAVHRLTHWIRQKDDLNVLVPALSTYMGYATLTMAEKFLAFAPERFKADLQKLSSVKGRRHWRDDTKLLAKLTAL